MTQPIDVKLTLDTVYVLCDSSPYVHVFTTDGMIHTLEVECSNMGMFDRPRGIALNEDHQD